MKQIFMASIAVLAFASTALADKPEVTAVNAVKSDIAWTFEVTLIHPDTGWDHYADGWQVADAENTILGTRTLAHPHVAEQPFTRSLSGVVVPESVKVVYIQVSDNQSGWYDNPYRVELPN